MVNHINDIVNGTGKYLSSVLPEEVSIYDEYTEQNLDLPAVIIEITNNYTTPRITGRYRLIQTLVGLRVYANDHHELRSIVSTILLTLREIELPDGPVLAHTVDNTWMSDTTATINFRVKCDMQIAAEKETPKMLSLEMRERIKE